MKIKIDFVTNSSSASFLIADVRKNKSKPIEMKFFIGGKNCTFNMENVLGCRIIEEPEERDEIFNNKDYRELIDLMLHDQKDVDLYYLCASDQAEDPLEIGICYNGLLKENFKTKDIIILEGDGGY